MITRKASQKLILSIAMFMFSSLVPQSGETCPFCSAPSLTFIEQVDEAKAVVLTRWVSTKKSEGDEPASSVYEIVEYLKGPEAKLTRGTKVTLPIYRKAKNEDLFFFTAIGEKELEWNTPVEMSRPAFEYLKKAPSSKTSIKERLEYYVQYLENEDELIAIDAYSEFANAPFDDIEKVSSVMPRADLRKWILDPKTSSTRLALYGLLLGLCGQEEDISVFREKILEPTKDFRLGIDGVMSGYLLLAKEDGIDLLNETKFKDPEAVFSETYAAMQALRFIWTYGKGRVGKQKLRESMRLLLDRADMSDLVIADLARWKDWEVQDRLMKLYGTEGYEIPAIKRSIIRFMLASIKDVPKNKKESDPLPEHAAKGKKYIEKLRKIDPKTVKQAERFFFLN
jgi:hypothetical protein